MPDFSLSSALGGPRLSKIGSMGVSPMSVTVRAIVSLVSRNGGFVTGPSLNNITTVTMATVPNGCTSGILSRLPIGGVFSSCRFGTPSKVSRGICRRSVS